MGTGDRGPWLLRGTVVALALGVGLVTWLTTRDGDEVPGSPVVEARIVSEEDLSAIAAETGHPVYWAGPLPATELEASRSADGSVQVRYLEDGAEPGQQPAAFLTVGSYPLADPAGALDAFAADPGAVVRRSRDGRRVVTSAAKSTSVYFASPDDSVQVEVYDPSPERALALALSERVRPVE